MQKMSTSVVMLLMVLLGAGVVSSWSATAAAQETKDLSQEEDEELARKVLVLIREGNSAFDAEEFNEAFAKYEEAYEMYPDPAILVRMGRTAAEIGEPGEAIGYYEEFRRLMPDDPTSDELTERIAELEAKLPGTVSVTSEPAGASVYVDDQLKDELGVTPLDLELAPGTHTVYLELERHKGTSQDVEVEAGGDHAVSVELFRARSLAAADEDDGANDKEVVELDDGGGFRADIYGYSALGVGVATLATSGVFVAMQTTAEDDVNNYDKQAPGASREELQGLKDDANSYHDAALITGAVGGALVLTGAGLLGYHYLKSDDADELSWGVDANVDADRAWIGVHGRF